MGAEFAMGADPAFDAQRIDVVALAMEMGRTHAAMVKAGAASQRDAMRPALKALEREFQASLLDPETKMKSSLQVAILAACALVAHE